MKILGVSGSLDAASANTALLASMARVLVGPTSLDVFVGIDALPYFSTDRDREPLDPSVRRWRDAVGAADAMVIATPEYAGGMPGALKNALDWLVGSGELYEKPGVIVSAAPSEERGGRAREGLEVTMTMQGARVCDSFTVAIGRDRTRAALAAAAATAASRVVGALTSGP
jgi:chromate reductase